MKKVIEKTRPAHVLGGPPNESPEKMVASDIGSLSLGINLWQTRRASSPFF